MAAPQPGQVVDGYVFKGGNPNDPGAWAQAAGDDLLKTLPPQTAAQVKALAEGRMQFPTGFAISKPYWQNMLNLTAQYDPTFDAANYNSRSKTRGDFTSGKSAQNITALNTVIGHLDHLDHAIDGLGNYAGDEPGPVLGIPLGPLAHANNSAAEFIARQSGTGQRYKDFDAAKTAVANELTRVFRGAGGAEADIQGYMKQLDGASSPQELRATVKSMANLINSRIQALGEQYSQGMGRSQDGIRLLTPDKQEAFQRMSQGISPKAWKPQGQASGQRPSLAQIFGGQ